MDVAQGQPNDTLAAPAGRDGEETAAEHTTCDSEALETREAPDVSEASEAPEAPEASEAPEVPETAKARRAPAASSEAVRHSMQGNKRANTKPELLVRARLREAGLTGYRVQWKVPGHPDIAWPGKKVALFVNGCFWHRCPHCRPSAPKTHVEYWSVKFDRNVERDRENVAALEEAGWTVHVVWECQLKKKTIDNTLDQLFPILSAELEKPLRTPRLLAEDEGERGGNGSCGDEPGHSANSGGDSGVGDLGRSGNGSCGAGGEGSGGDGANGERCSDDGGNNAECIV